MKYGDETKLLNASIPILERLYCWVNGTSFSIENSQKIDQRNAEALWTGCKFIDLSLAFTHAIEPPGHLDWFPTLVAAAGNPNITEQLLRGVQLGDRSYKNHLDGYNQMDLLSGKGPSKRREIFYFGGATLGALRVDNFKFSFYQQPYGWPGEKVTTDMPSMVNLRQDPFERTPMIRGETSNTGAFGYGNDFFAREFWRFVQVQQNVGRLAQTAIEYPPMQDPASFNLEAIKRKVEEMIKNRPGQ